MATKRTPSRILIIDAHPDPDAARFVHALAQAYERGAREAGHEVQSLKLAEIEFPLLRSNRDFQSGEPPRAIHEAQEWLRWCSHVVILYPLWLGSMPALLKGFLEQVLRPDFAFAKAQSGKLPVKLLTGRSAHIFVTMGMPAFFYRWYFRAHSLRVLERNILRFTGFSPVRSTVIGNVETPKAAVRTRWLAAVAVLGRAAR